MYDIAEGGFDRDLATPKKTRKATAVLDLDPVQSDRIKV
jgi:hypothetical protein